MLRKRNRKILPFEESWFTNLIVERDIIFECHVQMECALLHRVYKNVWYQKSYSKIQHTCIWYHMRNTRYSIEHGIDIYETLQKLRTCKVRLISILISNASWGISRVYIWNRKQAVTEPGEITTKRERPKRCTWSGHRNTGIIILQPWYFWNGIHVQGGVSKRLLSS